MRFSFALLLVLLAAAPAFATPASDASFGKAVHFDGTDDFVRMAPNASGLAQGTVELWIDWSNSTFDLQIWGGSVGVPGTFGDYARIGRHFSSGGLAGGVYTSVWTWASSSGDVPRGWTHVALTWGSDGMRFYIDGELAGSNPYTGAVPNYALELVGASSWGFGYAGAVDDLRVWDVQRSEVEIQSTMRAPLAPAVYQAAGSGLVAYYPFDEFEDLGVFDAGIDDFRDLSPNANHADAEGGAVLTPGAVQVEASSWSKIKSQFGAP